VTAVTLKGFRLLSALTERRYKTYAEICRVPRAAVVSELGGAGRAATRRASQREARHLEIRILSERPVVCAVMLRARLRVCLENHFGVRFGP
jgi:hypothetical protein